MNLTEASEFFNCKNVKIGLLINKYNRYEVYFALKKKKDVVYLLIENSIHICTSRYVSYKTEYVKNAYLFYNNKKLSDDFKKYSTRIFKKLI